MFKNYGNKWVHGTIFKKLIPVTYLIKTYSKICKRHINQLIDSNVNRKTIMSRKEKDVLKEFKWLI